jgi:hypothetical protein
MLSTTIILEKCASQTMETPHGIDMQQDFYSLCDTYMKIINNDKGFCKLLEGFHQFLNDLKINKSQLLSIEHYKLLQYLFELSEMPIGYAKTHKPYYVFLHEGKRFEVPSEVITFSAYKRLAELHYDLTDYNYLPILAFSGFKVRQFWGVNEICETSIYKSSL